MTLKILPFVFPQALSDTRQPFFGDIRADFQIQRFQHRAAGFIRKKQLSITADAHHRIGVLLRDLGKLRIAGFDLFQFGDIAVDCDRPVIAGLAFADLDPAPGRPALHLGAFRIVVTYKPLRQPLFLTSDRIRDHVERQSFPDDLFECHARFDQIFMPRVQHPSIRLVRQHQAIIGIVEGKTFRDRVYRINDPVQRLFRCCLFHLTVKQSHSAVRHSMLRKINVVLGKTRRLAGAEADGTHNPSKALYRQCHQRDRRCGFIRVFVRRHVTKQLQVSTLQNLAKGAVGHRDLSIAPDNPVALRALKRAFPIEFPALIELRQGAFVEIQSIFQPAQDFGKQPVRIRRLSRQMHNLFKQRPMRSLRY
ncbi:hypothetical protein [Ruegeria sp.]|uniref:hypothetical protein n=1 Tax=Ruegeria sp. TaxID=1879320 RepID=UPI002316B738|nr:hypothetical protein [Ruegeria sp.]MDA7965791.1 hypothetical protein [Ruegeria sp.]